MSEKSQTDAAGEKPGLSRAMWVVVIVVGAVVAIGIGAAVWFLTAGAPADGAATPSSSASIQPGPDPEATPTTGSEVLPPEGDAEDENRIPSRTPAGPLVPAPLPESATGEGTLVDGFPDAIMGPAPGADVVQNAIATEGTTMQVSLVARTDAARDDVSAYYAQLWASLGLTPQADAGDGTLSYTGGFESLSLAFTPASGTGTVYMIHGVFRTE
jgi:hypothetical protein